MTKPTTMHTGKTQLVSVVPTTAPPRLQVVPSPRYGRRTGALRGMKSALEDNDFVCVFFFRGAWCRYCVGYCQMWGGGAKEIAALGGRVIAVSASPAREMWDNFEKWGISAEVQYIPDPHMSLARVFGVQTCKSPGIGVFTQPAMFALTTRGASASMPRLLFDWRADPHPTFKSSLSAYPRPSPSDVVTAVLTAMSGMPVISCTAIPSGNVTLVSSDIQDSTMLWEAIPEYMPGLLREHDGIIKRSAAQHNGFISKTEGDAFVIAFASVDAAMRHCIGVQRSMRTAPWRAAFPRVRTAVHHGYSLSGGAQYEGALLDGTMYVEEHTKGGFIGISTEVYEEVRKRTGEFGSWVAVPDTSPVVYRNVDQTTQWGGDTAMVSPTPDVAREEEISEETREFFDRVGAPRGTVTIAFVKLEQPGAAGWDATPVAMYRGVHAFLRALALSVSDVANPVGSVFGGMGKWAVPRQTSAIEHDRHRGSVDSMLGTGSDFSNGRRWSEWSSDTSPTAEAGGTWVTGPHLVHVVKTSGASAMLASTKQSVMVSALLTLQEHVTSRSNGKHTTRAGLLTGEPFCCVNEAVPGGVDYFGPVVNRAARIAGRARAGQILTLDCIPDPMETVDGLVFRGVPGRHKAYSHTKSAYPARIDGHDNDNEELNPTESAVDSDLTVHDGPAAKVITIAEITDFKTQQANATNSVKCMTCGILVVLCFFNSRCTLCGNVELVEPKMSGEGIVLVDAAALVSPRPQGMMS